MKMKAMIVMVATLFVVAVAQDTKSGTAGTKTIDPVLMVQEKQKKEVKDGEMKQYFLVLLKRGPVRNHDSTTAAVLQKGHMENIGRLYKEGKIDLAGPMGHDGDLRGIFVFNCDSYEEVLMHCTTDPAIQAGRLVVEIYPWWAGKGSILR